METIDCRNMDCPAPVICTKRAIAERPGETLQILVSPGAPVENVSRFAANNGFKVTRSEIDGDFCLTIAISDKGKIPGTTKTPVKSGRLAMLISSDRLGEGSEELGRLLMKNMIITLLDQDKVPDRILFINSGVLLATEGSELIDTLEQLGNKGVEVLSCGACLEYYKKKDLLKAGAVTNMFTIVETMTNADTVINI